MPTGDVRLDKNIVEGRNNVGADQYWSVGNPHLLDDAPTVKLPAQPQKRPLGKRIKRGVLIGLGSAFGLFMALALLGAIIGPQPARPAAEAPVASTAPVAPVTVIPSIAPVPAPAPVAPIIAAPAPVAVPTSTTAASQTRAAVGAPKPAPKHVPKPAPPSAAVAQAPAPAASSSSSGGSHVCVKQDKNGRWRDAHGRFCSLG